MVRSWTAAEARSQCEAACYNRSISLASGAQLTYADVGDAQASQLVALVISCAFQDLRGGLPLFAAYRIISF